MLFHLTFYWNKLVESANLQNVILWLMIMGYLLIIEIYFGIDDRGGVIILWNNYFVFEFKILSWNIIIAMVLIIKMTNFESQNVKSSHRQWSNHKKSGVHRYISMLTVTSAVSVQYTQFLRKCYKNCNIFFIILKVMIITNVFIISISVLVDIFFALQRRLHKLRSHFRNLSQILVNVSELVIILKKLTQYLLDFDNW